MKITFISDTHTKHNQLNEILPGGDIIIHAGDISSMGYKHEIQQFLKWYNNLDNYTHKIFIAGNHDWGFEREPKMCKELLDFYDKVIYLEDNLELIGDNYQDTIKIWGSPWQPEFYNWAFNLPRGGEKLKEKWDLIPNDIDILITHGPAYGKVDTIIGQYNNLGCELLSEKINQIKPKIHVCGHIHSGRGYKYHEGTHFINASVLDERYYVSYKPFTIDWDKKTNNIEFL